MIALFSKMVFIYEIEEKIIKLRDKANKCIEKKDFVSLSIIGKDLRKLKKRLELANKNV